jgi:hypothetical protein
MTAGLLVIPLADAVIFAVPVSGVPLDVPTQLIKFVSQTPAQIDAEEAPLAFSMVAMLMLEELKVKFAVWAALEASSAVAVIVITSPAFIEIDVGERITWVIALDELFPPPPHPVRTAIIDKMNPGMTANRLMRPPRPALKPGGSNEVW